MSRPLAVFDVDGVLADVGHRVHHLEGGRHDWRAFFAAAKDDPPLETGLALAHELASEHDLAAPAAGRRGRGGSPDAG